MDRAVQTARLAGRIGVAGYDPDALAAARGYEFIPLAVALWSAGNAAERWVEVLTALLSEGVELQHATGVSSVPRTSLGNNCDDAYHHLWDIERIAASQSAKV